MKTVFWGPIVVAICSSVAGPSMASPVSAPAAQVWITVPSSQEAADQPPVRLETYVYRPSRGRKHPLLIFSHGSAADPKRSEPAEHIAEFFVQRGFLVVVPMRRGRGRSSGTSPEGMDRNCDVRSWRPGIQAAFDDLTAVIEYAQRLPDADPKQIVLAGASRGGFLSVAYAAEGAQRHKVTAVINFVGGWVAQAEDNCPTDFNLISYEAFGRKAGAPELWLYGANDQHYTRNSIHAYVDAYASGGRKPMFELFEGAGHGMPFVPALWGDSVDRFLNNTGLETRSRNGD